MMPLFLPDPALEAARRGTALAKWVDGFTLDPASQTVLTAAVLGDDATRLIHNLVAGTQVIVVYRKLGVHTITDQCYFELGWCTEVDGGGDFTPVTSVDDIATGDTKTGFTDVALVSPAICIKYSAGARSITYRIAPNDTACSVSMAWRGWWEKER